MGFSESTNYRYVAGGQVEKIINIAEAGTVQILSHTPPSLSEPSPIWNVPFRHNPFFTGRDQILSDIHKKLQTTPLLILNGMGGVGKTRAAVEYAHQHKKDYHDIFWTQASSSDVLTTQFLQLARLLKLPEKDTKEQEKVVQAVKQWFEVHTSWLLILDNVEDSSFLHGFLPTRGNGHLLVTTRDQTLELDGQVIPLQELEREDGALLLLRRGGIIAPDASLEQAPECDKIVAFQIEQRLQGLPLALDQAGAYIKATQGRLQDYLQLYQAYSPKLLEERGPAGTHPDPVATTWTISFQTVKNTNPLASDVLKLCAFLAPDAIPEELFTIDPQDQEAQQTAPHPIKTGLYEWNQVVLLLMKFSLIKRDVHTATIYMHPLVQKILQEEMSPEEQRRWAEQTIPVVNAVFPFADITTWEQCRRYLSHALMCTSLIQEHAFASEEAKTLMVKLAIYDKDHGLYTEAEQLYEEIVKRNEQVLGPEHPDTAQSLNNLAYLYYSQGKYEQAEPLLERALAIYEQVLGPEHPDTAQSLNNLAALYRSQGKYEQAEPLYQRALAICEHLLGPDHPTTRIISYNYALLQENLKNQK